MGLSCGKMDGVASGICLTILLVLDVQPLLAGSSYCRGPGGWALPTMAAAERIVVVFNSRKALLYHSDNTAATLPRPRSVSQSPSLSSPLFPYQGNSVVSCAIEVEEEFPSVCAGVSFGSWRDPTQWDAVKKGHAYRRRSSALSKEQAPQ